MEVLKSHGWSEWVDAPPFLEYASSGAQRGRFGATIVPMRRDVHTVRMEGSRVRLWLLNDRVEEAQGKQQPLEGLGEATSDEDVGQRRGLPLRPRSESEQRSCFHVFRYVFL